jgi:hypothetical protein
VDADNHAYPFDGLGCAARYYGESCQQYRPADFQVCFHVFTFFGCVFRFGFASMPALVKILKI